MKVIQSAQNQTYKDWGKLRRRKGREKAGRYLIEGPHLVEEALKEQGIVVALICDETYDRPAKLSREDIEVYQLAEPLFQELSATETPQGIMAVCAIHEHEEVQGAQRFLLIDAVRDPGNLGTLLRTADAAGIDVVYLGGGCVDLYNDKVLRSTQGSHFHVPVINKKLADVIPMLQEQGVPVFGTSLEGELLNNQGNRGDVFALIVGNEGHGVNPELLQMADAALKIPIYGRAESLNVAVAAGILMYWLRGI